MVHEISRREVLNNLIRFKDNLLELREKDRLHPDQGKRTYKVLLNGKTGDMRFTQKVTALEHHIARKGTKKETAADWKEIRVVVHQTSPHEAAHFEVTDSLGHSLKPADIDPLAWRIASETINILNEKAHEMKGKHEKMLPEEAALHDLSSIHLKTQHGQIQDLPGWKGSLSRIDAEQYLTGKTVGTYLLREGDEITVSMAFHFSEENFLSVHPYVITVVEKDDKIADILLLQTNKGWILYHDDPNLKDSAIYHYYASPDAVLHSLKDLVKQPLV